MFLALSNWNIGMVLQMARSKLKAVLICEYHNDLIKRPALPEVRHVDK
jgi:hypothetical protein